MAASLQLQHFTIISNSDSFLAPKQISNNHRNLTIKSIPIISKSSSKCFRKCTYSSKANIIGSSETKLNCQIYRSDLLIDQPVEEPLKIGIVGFGNFGQFIAKAIQRQGHQVLATSRSDYSDYCQQHKIKFFRDVDGLCEEMPDVVLVCSSIMSTEAVLGSIPMEKLSPDTIFADVLSVLPRGFGIICTHPMFGPESGKNGWEGLPFVYDKVRVAEYGAQQRNCQRFLSIFECEGCRMVEMSCEEHDRYAAGSQFITHTIGRILSHLDLESTPINTKGYESLLKLTENTVSDSYDLYYGLFMYNVNAQAQIENLDRAFDSVKQKLFGRLHDLLRKQIVERVPLPLLGGPLPSPMKRSSANEVNATPYKFLPDSDDMKDLSSFASDVPASHPKEASSHVAFTK
ncbi:hypothetical protein Sjap_026074 [Stephania japonica]|uniref:Prephenate/arogenate dehydrogenase domain-containing protein n=1 Tax=Stephania japonica TaxID=461633 RepID=A0AAP0HER5_9MAGN